MERTRWPIEDLRRMQINSEDAPFLAEIGLPNLPVDDLHFSLSPMLLTWDRTDCHRIGTYGLFNDIPLFVREDVPGIWTIEEATGELHLVNSSSKAFSRFVSLREKYLIDIEKLLPVQVQQQLVTVVLNAMKQIDPQAMAPAQLWTDFMEDMYYQTDYDDEYFEDEE